MTAPDDTMTADEARGLVDVEHGGLCHEDAVRALRAVIALHEAAAVKERHAAFYLRQAFVCAVDATRRADALALREALPDVWERLRSAPEPEWPTAGVQPEAPDDAAFRAAWQAGAEATRAGDVAALRAERLRLRDEAAKARAIGLRHAAEDTTARALGAGVCADIVEGMPLPAPPAPPQSPEAPPDGETEPGGDGAPAGGLSVAGAYVDAAGVCEQRAQTQDRLAAASPPGERLSRAWAADELRYVADRIRALAGGP